LWGFGHHVGGGQPLHPIYRLIAAIDQSDLDQIRVQVLGRTKPAEPSPDDDHSPRLVHS
jgi:hypothetical protein